MPTVGHTIRVACRQSYALTDDQVNVLHFMIDTVPTPNTNAALMTDIGTAISLMFDEVAAIISNAVNAIDLTFYDIDDDAPVGVISWPAPYTGGTASGESLPSHDSLMVLLPTGVKRTIGRIYLPTSPEAAQSGGIPTSAAFTAVDAMASFLIGGVGGDVFNSEFHYVVHSRGSGNQYPALSARLAPFVAVQRRRKRGRGS